MPTIYVDIAESAPEAYEGGAVDLVVVTSDASGRPCDFGGEPELVVYPPYGATVRLAPRREGVGRWVCAVQPVHSGVHRWQFRQRQPGRGAALGVYGGSFVVPSGVGSRTRSTADVHGTAP